MFHVTKYMARSNCAMMWAADASHWSCTGMPSACMACTPTLEVGASKRHRQRHNQTATPAHHTAPQPPNGMATSSVLAAAAIRAVQGAPKIPAQRVLHTRRTAHAATGRRGQQARSQCGQKHAYIGAIGQRAWRERVECVQRQTGHSVAAALSSAAGDPPITPL